MKRFSLLIAALLVLTFIVIAPLVMAAGTVSQTFTSLSRDVSLLTFNWTADATNGSVPATASIRDFAGYVVLVVTNPGTTAPTDDYDITLTDEDGVDVMGGELANRDTANSEHAVPKVGSSFYGNRFVSGKLTLNISNNSVNSATGVVKVFVSR